MVHEHMLSYQKDEKKSAKQKFLEWAVEIKNEISETKTIADKFLKQLDSIFNSPDNYKNHLQERVEAAMNHFLPKLKKTSKSIISQIEKVKSEKKIKAYLEELSDLDAAFFKQIQLLSKASAMVKSAVNNEDFSKESIHSKNINKEKVEEINEIKNIIGKKSRSKKDKNSPKIPKPDTKKVSFDFYKAGKTVDEIAKERNMAPSTIEGHLAHYAGLGMVDVKTFVTEDKLQNIITVSKTLDTTLYGPIKQSLGEEYTYSEIKFAMSYYLNSKKD